jgi:hypothetical protein
LLIEEAPFILQNEEAIKIMAKVTLRRVKGNPLKLYEELCSKLKEFEIFENLIDMDKLSKHQNRSRNNEQNLEKEI